MNTSRDRDSLLLVALAAGAARVALANVAEGLRLELVAGERPVVELVVAVVVVRELLVRGGGRLDHQLPRPGGRVRARAQHPPRQLRLLRRRHQVLRHHLALRLHLHDVVGLLLDHAQEDDHVLLGDALPVRQQRARRRAVALQLGEERLDALLQRVQRRLPALPLLLVHLHLALRARQLLLQGLEAALGGHVALRVLALEDALLLLQLQHHLLQPLDVLVELVSEVEEGVVLVLRLDEGEHQLVHLGDARGRLDLGEHLVVVGHLGGHVLHRVQQVAAVGAACERRRPGGEVLLLGGGEVVEDLVPPHLVLDALLVLNHHPQLLHFVVPHGVLAVGLRLERGHLVLRLVARLVGDVGDLDHVRNLLLLLLQVPLQLGVDLVEGGALAPQVIDLRPHLFVI
mmetsp:Transcript_30580/g.66719  ORF Transcript_30580/g.66719 Transcript_30580/m.66719 type:complete len:401 (+) Transcript_30580:357-1559(+)